MNNEYDISQAFQRIEETLIKSMSSNLGRHLREEAKEEMNWSAWQAEQLKSLEIYKKRNRKRLNKTFFNINSDINDLLRKSRDDGKLEQEKLILEAIENGEFKSFVSNCYNIGKTQYGLVYANQNEVKNCYNAGICTSGYVVKYNHYTASHMYRCFSEKKFARHMLHHITI